MNAIKTMHELINAGFEQKQAEVLVSAVEQHSNDNHATKFDVTEVKAELKSDIAELRADFKIDIAKINERLNIQSWIILSVGGGLLIGMITLILTK